MPLDKQTCTHFQNLIHQLNPDGPPTAQLIHRDRDSHSTQIGILDASFNPMTLAHQALIKTAKDACILDEMLLMLSATNVDKNPSGADLGQRLAMLVHYAQQHNNLSVAICSHARFVDKIIALKPCYPANTQFFFIVGYDTLIRLFDPKYYEDMQSDLQTLFETCHFIAANRGENDRHTLDVFLQKEDVQPFANRIHPILLPQAVTDISSTKVRSNIKSNESIEHLVPKAIIESIRALHLYTE
ncbi:MAG: nicotinate (nicotinamide) nucleotide adenylyltransferase [Candidatus Latescibacterota bacterium]|jgi:nicotinate (nicotinamide) nucleotide adenylyltransferase